jgi:outer membrane lipoprotein-sorting protein
MKKLIVILLSTGWITAYGQISGSELVSKVNERNEGQQLTQKVAINMVDKRGKTQERSLVWYRMDVPDQRKSIIFYESPANVQGTAFLTYDYHSHEKEDAQWLYLPALRKTRRISAANRGDYFLGTDLTYEDVKLATKIGAGDYHFKTIGEKEANGFSLYQLEGTPKNDKIAKELGYGKVEYMIDQHILMPRSITYWDIAGNKLKTVEFMDIKEVQGIYTVHRIDAENFKTNHKTSFIFNNPDYQSELPDDLFNEQAMVRGI